jgi:hypothetical protein
MKASKSSTAWGTGKNVQFWSSQLVGDLFAVIWRDRALPSLAALSLGCLGWTCLLSLDVQANRLAGLPAHNVARSAFFGARCERSIG